MDGERGNGHERHETQGGDDGDSVFPQALSRILGSVRPGEHQGDQPDAKRQTPEHLVVDPPVEYVELVPLGARADEIAEAEGEHHHRCDQQTEQVQGAPGAPGAPRGRGSTSATGAIVASMRSPGSVSA